MLIHVPVNHIDDNPFQRRQDYGDVDSLAADIQQRGLLQIPRGRLIFTGGGQPVKTEHYSSAIDDLKNGHPDVRVQLAFGHRRLRAWQLLSQRAAGYTLMPVYVEALDDDAMLDAVWSENQHRTDINPIEQAELLAEKLDRIRAAGGSQTTLATEWGLDRSTIANKLRLLDLPPDVQTAVRARRLSERQATALLPVLDIATRLNGRPIDYAKGTKPEPYGPPIRPDAFIAHALKADNLPSDAIRAYSQQLLKYVAVPLPDDIATLDTSTIGPAADEETPIVQPLCAGCPQRYNQSCLNKPCRDAKYQLYQQRLPALATALTGLPWSDAPDADIFPRNADRDELHALRQAYADGRRDALVIAWRPQGYYENWFDGKNTGWRDPSTIANDWRRGLLLGRLPQANAVAGVAIVRPPRHTWSRTRNEARQRAKDRAQQAFRDALAPLAQHPDAVRALAYFLMDRGNSAVHGDPAELAQRLADYSFRFVYTNDPDDLRRALKNAGLDPTAVDSADEMEQLREAAAVALDDWYNHRDRPGPRQTQAAADIRRAADAFLHRAVITPTHDDDDLRELAHWLALALADVDTVTAESQPAPEAAS